MGREAVCGARSGGEAGEGRALLEHDHVLFRGAFRRKLMIATLTSVTARGGELTLKGPEGTLVLELGDAAARWADAIRNPPSVLDKLGVKAGQKLALLGTFEAAFVRALTARLGAAPARRASAGCDHVLLAGATASVHARLARLVDAIRPAGGIWVVYPRGGKAVSEDSLRQAARSAGLTDIKICRFSETHGAVRLVIPKALR